MSMRMILAHHEAAHVVADRVGGIAVSRTSVIDPIGGRTDVLGCEEAELECLAPVARRERLESAVIGLLAGPIAEEAYTGVYDTERAAADLHSAAELGFACLPDGLTWATFEQRLTLRARQLISDRWSVICELASELADRGEMTEDQLDTFLAGRLS
jgi:hypothetical protein